MMKMMSGGTARVTPALAARGCTSEWTTAAAAPAAAAVTATAAVTVGTKGC
jgi:hypothetical protein